MRGPAHAPAAIRAMLVSEHGNAAAESGLEVGVDFHLDDLGDVALVDTLTATPSDDVAIIAAVKAAVQSGAMPLILGGDHAISTPVVAALAAAHGPLNILHFEIGRASCRERVLMPG